MQLDNDQLLAKGVMRAARCPMLLCAALLVLLHGAHGAMVDVLKLEHGATPAYYERVLESVSSEDLAQLSLLAGTYT
jgi:hypothetical protein